jgi:hypothetical protein
MPENADEKAGAPSTAAASAWKIGPGRDRTLVPVSTAVAPKSLAP